jgi:UDP-glucuronate decarboxylase
MLELARKCGAKFLLASTSEVYGDPKQHPQKENYWGNVNPVGVRSCYDEGKRAAETMVYEYEKKYDLDVRVVRIFNTYGPRMAANDGRVVSNFITQALKNEPLTIYGDGSQTRSFCYVSDTVRGLISLMKHNYTRPVNIGNPREITIAELATKIFTHLNLAERLTHLPLPSDDPVRRCPDITVAIEELAWTPNVCLGDGLLRTIEYFRN